MMKKIGMRLLLIATLVTGIQVMARAQFETQDEPPDGDPGGDPDAVPLDPGTWILVAAAAGYGIKKRMDIKNEARRKNLKQTADFKDNPKIAE